MTSLNRMGCRCMAVVLSFSSLLSAFAMSTADFQGLINAATVGGRIELAEDVDLTTAVTISKSLTIASVEGSRFAIRQNASYAGSFLIVANGSTAEIFFENIVFDGNKASGVRLTDSLIKVNGGKVTLGDGAIVRDCSGASGKEGTTLCVNEGGVLEMLEGAEIRDCDNDAYGTAVYIRKGTFNMRGGLITGCSSLRTSGGNAYGGAVYEWEGSVNMSGGLITGNTAEGCAAGLVVYTGSLTISGDATLTNNVSAGEGCANDVFYQKNQNFTVSGDYRGSMTLYVDARPSDSGGTISQVVKPDKESRFSGLGNIAPQGYPEFGLSGWSKGSVATFWALRQYARGRAGKVLYFATGLYEVSETLEDGDTIYFMNDEVWTSSFNLAMYGLTARKEFTLSSLPGVPTRTISRKVESSTPFSLLEVKGLAIRLENIVLDGNGTGGSSVANSTTPIVQVGSNGTLTLGDGAVLRNGSCSTKNAGALVNGSGAKLVMEDGSAITGCELTGGGSYGTAVSIENSSWFEMKGGTIGGCTALTTSAATSGYGGTVYVYGGNFVMTGGTIAGNVCEKSVGGVLYYSGTMSLSGTATIAGNSGLYPDLYVHDGASKRANVHASGILSGRIGISAANLTAGELLPITADSGLGGIWNVVPSAQGGVVPGLAAALDSQSPGDVKWQTSAGSIDGVEFASVADAQAACPRELSVDPADLSGLPHVFSGCACEIEAQIAVDFVTAEVMEYLAGHPEGIVLLQTEGGSVFGSGISFSLPAGADDLTVVRGRTRCRLKKKSGFGLSIK